MVSPPSFLSHQSRHAPQRTFRSGQAVMATVIRVSGRQHALVRIGNSVVRAHTKLHLTPGQQLRVRVFIRGSVVVLRRAGRAAAPSPAEAPAPRLPANATLSNVIGILARAGLPASEGSAEALLARARRLGHRSIQSMRFLAILQEKGVEAPDALLEELLTLADTGDNDEGERPRDRGSPNDNRDEHTRSQDESSGPDAQESSDDALEALTIANHMKGRRDHWVVVPFSTESRGVEVNGVMRVLLDSDSGAARRMVLSVRAPSRLWHVAVESGTHGVSRVVLLCDPQSLTRRLRREVTAFRTALADNGIRLDVSPPPAGFDGFSVDPAEYRQDGIDRLL